MKINAETRLAPILKHHAGALDAIVSLRPHYEKLRNPILRKLMAGRTSIRQAAKIGGCTPEDFFNALMPLGFEIDRGAAAPAPEAPEMPAFMQSLQEEKVVTLDVRPILAGGKDPLSAILGKLKEIGDDEVLKIVNTFEPTPLMGLLKKQGYESYAKEIDSDTVETWFRKTTVGKMETAFPANKDAEGWAPMLARFGGKLAEVDVREMEMPQPMMTILDALEKLAPGNALFVHHKRVPIFLLPELKDRNFDFRIREIDGDYVQMLIFRN